MALALRTMVIPTNPSDSLYKVNCRALLLEARITHLYGAARKYKALSGDGGTDVMQYGEGHAKREWLVHLQVRLTSASFAHTT